MTATVPPTVTPTAVAPMVSFSSPSPPAEPPDRYNFLLLGGDYREHRAGTGRGDKTDVILLVSILMENPVKITVVQIPRNLYVPVEAMDNQWLYAVYGREGFVGLQYYFQQAFDVDLHGIFYVNMDSFVYLIDSLGGIWVADEGIMLGERTLAYLRDNDNNWEHGTYDAGGRQFKVLYALAEKVKTRFRENGLVTAKDL